MRAARALALAALVGGPFSAHAWEGRIDGSGTGLDEATSVALDARGDVIAVGGSHDATRLNDFFAVKRDGVTGTELWRRSIFGTGGGGCCGTFEAALDAAVDPAGTVFVAGYLHYATPRAQDFTALRLRATDGSEQWRALYDASGGSYFDLADVAYAIALDSAGNPVVAGRVMLPFGAPTNSGFVVRKLDAVSGAPLWTLQLAGSGINEARAVAIDIAGDVVAAGSLWNGSAYEFFVTKRAGATGNELWTRNLGAGVARALAIDTVGNVIAGGSRSGAAVVKLDGVTGETAWERDVVGLPGGYGLVWDVAADAAGDAIAVGELDTDASGTGEALVMKFSGTTGTDRWPALLVSGTGSGGNVARAVALDASGEVLVAGQLSTSSGARDLLVLKLDGETRAPLWRRDIDRTDDYATDLAITAQGDVVVVGVLAQDFGTAKLRGLDGADFPPCGDVDDDQDVDAADVLRLRQQLAGIPPDLAAPAKCSVIGGSSDCDVVDAVALRRWRLSLGPGLASVCAAVFQ